MRILVAAVLLAGSVGSQLDAQERQQSQPAIPVQVRVRWQEKSVTVRYGNDRYTVSLDTLVLGSRPDTIGVLAYESCLVNVGEGGGGQALTLRRSTDSLWGEWDHHNRKVHVRMRYLLTQPNRGLKLTETPLKPPE